MAGAFSSSVEVISYFGICKSHQLSLPFPICNHSAILLPQASAILVCGQKNCHKDSMT